VYLLKNTSLPFSKRRCREQHLGVFRKLGNHINVMLADPRKINESNLKPDGLVQMILTLPGGPYSQRTQPLIFRGVGFFILPSLKLTTTSPWKKKMMLGRLDSF